MAKFAAFKICNNTIGVILMGLVMSLMEQEQATTNLFQNILIYIFIHIPVSSITGNKLPVA